MNKINLIKVFGLFLFIFTMSSCSSDDSKVEDYGTSTGNYFPLETNNKWWYVDNNNEVSLMYVGYPTNFNNLLYYYIDDGGDELNVSNWIAQKGASYYQKVGVTFIPFGDATIKIDEYETKILRDDLPVGDVWNGSSPLKVTLLYGGSFQDLPSSLTYTGTILERDATEILGGVTYTQIIKMKMHVIETINSETTTSDLEYWFAKDIGIIWESVTNSFNNETQTRYLTSFESN